MSRGAESPGAAALLIGGRLEALFAELARTEVQYCLRRGGESALTAGDVDLLVSPQHMPAFAAAVERVGFLRLPAWGYAPHRFYVTYDPWLDRWIRLDVVTEIAFGRPFPTLKTDLALRCFSGRRQEGPVFLPLPEDELLILLLHCLLDRRGFPQPYRGRLTDLAGVIAADGPSRPSSFAAQLALILPARLSCSRLMTILLAGEWGDLLTLGPSVIAKLERGQRFERLARTLIARALRGLDHLAHHASLPSEVD